MTVAGPKSPRELRALTADRCARFATMASLEEISGVQWAIDHRFAAPLTADEQAALARRKAELQRGHK